MKTENEIKPVARDWQTFLQVFLTDRQVADRYSVSRQTPWAWLKKDPTFPKPIALSRGCTRWRLADLEAWEVARTAAA